MSGKSRPHKHGMTLANLYRPKSKQWKRRNKAKARVRSDDLQAKIKAALKAGPES